MEERSFDDVGMQKEVATFLAGPWQDFYNAHMELAALVKENLYTKEVKQRLNDYRDVGLDHSTTPSCRTFPNKPYRTHSHRSEFNNDQAAELLYGQLGLQAEFANGIEPYMNCLASSRRNLPLEFRLGKLIEKWDAPSQLQLVVERERKIREGERIEGEVLVEGQRVCNLGIGKENGRVGVFEEGQFTKYAIDHAFIDETCGQSFPRIANEIELWCRKNENIIPQQDRIAIDDAVQRYRDAYNALLPFIEQARVYLNAQQQTHANAMDPSKRELVYQGR